MLGEKGMVQKRTFYEWSSRVPLIMRLPDGAHAGMVRPEPVSLIDLLPTMCDLAGVAEEERLPVDGHSLLPLLDGDITGERVVFSEYHAQGSHTPCFMIRRAQYKYIYIHGYDEQLFDLENVAADPAWKDVATDLRRRILAHFDPEDIERAVSASIKQRWLVKSAMVRTRTRWDAEPRFDPTHSIIEQYLPRSRPVQ
jgi:choline-sulfatase